MAGFQSGVTVGVAKRDQMNTNNGIVRSWQEWAAIPFSARSNVRAQ